MVEKLREISGLISVLCSGFIGACEFVEEPWGPFGGIEMGGL